jgi:serine/threonine protein kinase
MVHRDIKPANILLSGDGDPILRHWVLQVCQYQRDVQKPSSAFRDLHVARALWLAALWFFLRDIWSSGPLRAGMRHRQYPYTMRRMASWVMYCICAATFLLATFSSRGPAGYPRVAEWCWLGCQPHGSHACTMAMLVCTLCRFDRQATRS